MIRWLSRQQLSPTAWDACIAASEKPLIYALSWYLDVVSPNWSALVREENGAYQTVLPLPVRREWGIAYLRQPFFAQQLGFFSRQQLENEERDTFLYLLQKRYRYLADYAFNTHDGVFPLPSFTRLKRCHTHYLRLNQAYESLRRQYRTDRRQRLRQAERRGQQVERSTDLEPLIRMFQESVAHKIPGGVSPDFYTLFRQLFQAVEQRRYSQLYYTLDKEGKAEAGAWFVRWKGHIVYLFNAAYLAARKHNGRTVLLDYIIRENAHTDQVLDFESPEVPAIANFYQSFGATPHPFLSWHDNRLPWWVNLPKRLRQYGKTIRNQTISTRRAE